MCPALAQSETDLEKVLFSCYQLLKENDGAMAVGDLQVEYFELMGRNLGRIAAAYCFRSVAELLEKCPDIRVVVDNEFKEIFAEVISGDMQKSSFREVDTFKVGFFYFVFFLPCFSIFDETQHLLLCCSRYINRNLCFRIMHVLLIFLKH